MWQLLFNIYIEKTDKKKYLYWESKKATAINVISAIGNSHEINDDEAEHIKPTQVRKGFIDDGGG